MGEPVLLDHRGNALAMGAYEGASRLSRELAMHTPAIRSADGDLLRDKEIIDARARDQVRNDGYAVGAVAIHRDSIVGSQFMLNARPNYKVLGLDEVWAEEFQEAVEARFSLYAEANDCWLDASRHNTLTEMIRLLIGVYVFTGEVLLSAEWMRDGVRPYATALQVIDTDRLCNPDNQADTNSLRRGVERNRFGAPMAYWIRSGYQNDYFGGFDYTWKRVPVRKPWGRLQMIHIYEQFRPDQTRGVSEMVSVLKQMKMTSKYQDIVLQNAVVNATYAATIESELPREAALETIGADNGGSTAWATSYLTAIAAYSEGAKNLNIDGVKIPHLFPGTKLQMRPAGQAGGIGTTFEESLLRHTAAALGLSYEQFSRDYSQTNYSSARASMNETWKYMQSRKKVVADRAASAAYELVLEEMWNAGDLPLPRKAPNFYEGLNKAAYSQCSWIGASRGQVDELKETQASIMRIKSGLSTYEDEIAKLGKDYREVFRQKAREQKILETLGVTLDNNAMTPGANDAQQTMNDNGNNGGNDKAPNKDKQQ